MYVGRQYLLGGVLKQTVHISFNSVAKWNKEVKSSRTIKVYLLIFLVISTPSVGLELMTPRSRVVPASDWATQAPLEQLF